MSIISRLRKTHPYLTPGFGDAFGSPNYQPDDPNRVDVSSSGDAPAPIARRTPPPDLYSDVPSVPNLSSTDYSGPRISGDRIIRPRPNAEITDPYERAQDYETNLLNYQPQKESAKHLLLRTGLGFLQGGIPGAAATAISGGLDRRAVDRNWQQQEEARTSNIIGQMNAQRRAQLQDQLTRAQIYKTANPDFTLGEGQVRYDASGKRIASGPDKTQPEFTLGDTRYGPQGNVIVTNPKLTPPKNLQTGKTVENGVTYQTEYDPEQKAWVKSIGADGQPIRLDSEPSYGKRADYFYKRQHEKESEALDLEQQINAIHPSAVDLDGNPKYSDVQKAQVERLTSQRQAALNEANNLRTQGDNAATQQTANPESLKTPSTHVFSKSAWLATHKGQESRLNEAIQAAKDAKYQIVQ